MGGDPAVVSSLTMELNCLSAATTACHGPQLPPPGVMCLWDAGCSRRSDGTEGSWKNTAWHRTEDFFHPLLDSTICAAGMGDPTSCLQGNFLPQCRGCDRQVSAPASAHVWKLNPGHQACDFAKEFSDSKAPF